MRLLAAFRNRGAYQPFLWVDAIIHFIKNQQESTIFPIFQTFSKILD